MIINRSNNVKNGAECQQDGIFSLHPEPLLSQRLGISRHISPLRFKLKRLAEKNLPKKTVRLDDWLVNMANARWACVVTLFAATGDFPTEEELSNDGLVTAICQPENRDRPQMLRLTAQLTTGYAVNVENFVCQTGMCRTGFGRTGPPGFAGGTFPCQVEGHFNHVWQRIAVPRTFVALGAFG